MKRIGMGLAEYLYYSINGSANGSAGTSPAALIFPLPFNYAWTKENVQVFRVASSYLFYGMAS